jgi:DNA-binding NarL/FixJ family response regulator
MNPKPTSIRLLLVDDHAVVRAGLNTILGADPRLTVIGALATVAEVRPAVLAQKPDVVLLDVRLPDGSGTSLVRELKALPSPPRVAILTSFAEPVEIFAALEAGVDAYLLKDSDADALVAALIAVAAGQQVLHPRIRPLVVGGSSPSVQGGRLAGLTGPERRILSLVTEGRTNKEIADSIGLAEKTVRNQMSVILSKLGVERRAQAVAVFVEEQAKLR